MGRALKFQKDIKLASAEWLLISILLLIPISKAARGRGTEDIEGYHCRTTKPQKPGEASVNLESHSQTRAP